MVDFLFLTASDPRLSIYTPEIKDLIDLEACKLGVANPSAYFAPNNEFMLALEGGKVMAITIVRRDDFSDATYLGYSLMITRPDARRRGFLAKMTMLYFFRSLPALVCRKICSPGRQLYVYSDISTPVVYAKITQLRTLNFYPNLIEGDSPADKARGVSLREHLVARCGIRDMWQRPGLVRDVDINTGVIQDFGGRPLSPQDSAETGIDKAWSVRWSSYVPPEADLLVIIPINPIWFVVRLVPALIFAFRRRKPQSLERALAA